MRLLIVARHFPPAVSGGARRPHYIARELVAQGHEVCVIAPEPSPGVPVAVVAHHHVGPDLAAPVTRASDARSYLRRWMLPDPDIRWALRASRVALPFAPDWIHTTSPPESSHVAGWLLKRRFRCRWSADFRDHWLDHPLYGVRARGGPRVAIERKLARVLLRRADVLMATTDSIAGEISRLTGGDRTVSVLEHAADPPPEPAPLEDEAIHIVHTGSFALSDPGRGIAPVLEGFAAAGDDRLRLHLIGYLREDERALVAASPASSRIVVHGALDYEIARSFQAAADILLLVTAPDAAHVPGKLAEYRTAAKPILAIGGGAWLDQAQIEAFSDAKEAFANLDRIAALGGGPTPAASAERFLSILRATA